MDERRDKARHRVLKAGTIEFGGGVIDCTVRNFSDTGAALDVSSPSASLSVSPAHPADGTHLACTVVWRKERRIGVRFG